MKALRQLSVASVFVLALAIPAFAGEIQTGVAGQMDTTSAGEIHTTNSEADAGGFASGLIQSLLALF